MIREALELTEPRSRIFVKHVYGRFQRRRWFGFAILLAIFLIGPWLQWDGRQAVLLDLPARRFYLFGLIVWPHEMYLLAGLLLALVLALFFFTTLAGRLWCGYACPQTVYITLFIEIERLIEGDRPRQQRLAGAPWTFERIWKAAVKHGLFLMLTGIVGFTSVAYFVPTGQLWHEIATGQLGAEAAFWLCLVAFGLYLDGAFFREQICLYPCPYGRFQGALTDDQSLVIGYDAQRGEPRREAGAAGRPTVRSRGAFGGDCVDCLLCVQVCPQGVDIRAGLQGECIGCARCVDACDRVMERVGKPQGLIRYDAADTFTQGRPGAPASGRPHGARLLARPKLVAYGVLFAGVTVWLGTYLATRPDVRLSVDRAPGLYTILPDGSVADLYTVRALSLDGRSRELHLGVDGIAGAALRGQARVVADSRQVPQTVAVVAPRKGVSGSLPIAFLLRDGDRVLARAKSRFIAP